MSAFEFVVCAYEKPGGRALRESVVFTHGANAVRHAEILSITHPAAHVVIEVKYRGPGRIAD